MSHVRKPSGRKPFRARIIAPVAAGAALLAGTGLYLHLHRPATLVQQLARQHLARDFGPRLSVETEYRPCSPRPVVPIPAGDCTNAVENAPNEEILRLQRRIVAGADSGVPDAIHAGALLVLAFGDSSGDAVTNVVERLRRLTASGDSSADVLSDLSAALLIRAGRKQAVDDLADAVQSAEAAVAREPRNRAALFNRALALETFVAFNAAAVAWRDYLAVERDARWAAEARHHLARIRRVPRKRLDPDAPDAVLAALAGYSPQEARELGWDTLLERWGRAVLRKEKAEAEAALHRAEVLGAALERSGKDASLADAVRAIRNSAGDSAATHLLAASHQAFGAGRAARAQQRYVAADSLLTIAARGAAGSPCLKAWTAVTLAPIRRGSRPAEADSLVRAGLALDPGRYPALTGTALLTLGSLRIKAMKGDSASQAYDAALPLLERSGEAVNIAGALAGSAEADWMLNRRPEAYREAYEAARLLRPHGDSQTLHRLLANLSFRLQEDGLSQVALRMNDEDVAVAQLTGVDVTTVEAHDLRAEALARVGNLDEAMAEVTTAEPLVDSLDGPARQYFRTMFEATRGVIDVERDPRKAEQQLSAAMPILRAQPTGVPLRLITALLARAEARLALGQVDSARADTEEVVDLLLSAQRSGATALAPELTRTTRSVLARVVVRLVVQGKVSDALQVFDYGLSVLGRRAAHDPSLQVLEGRVAVRYAVVGDTVIAWTVSSRGLHAQVTAVPPDLADRVRRAREALEQRDESQALPMLGDLYDWLIRPLRRNLAHDTALIIVPDDALAGVPFVALQDRRTGRYLVEDHTVRLAPTLADALAEASALGQRATPGAALMVQDPAFDPQLFPRLHRLAGAQAELTSVSGWARSTLVLAGAAARADTLVRLLPGVSVLHFAGHAVADEDDPDSSFLVLAPERRGDVSGRLTAGRIAGLKLGGLQLVVLSACTTLNGYRRGAGGFTGLGGAFLTAGAHGVVGSLWAVDDARTSALMRRFYAEYARDPDAAAALQWAQLDMLRNGAPGERSPAAWAGFEYAGR